MIRIFFQTIFLPLRLLFLLYLSFRSSRLKKKKILYIELPTDFQTSHSSFFFRKIRNSQEKLTQWEFLEFFRAWIPFPKLEEIHLFIPPMEWSLAEIYDLTTELAIFQKKGVKIKGYAREGSVSSLLILAKCDERILNENSEFECRLPSAEPSFYGKFLSQWGIEVTAFASGPYKSFAESFTRDSFSKPAKKNIEDLLLALQGNLLDWLTIAGKVSKDTFYLPTLSGSTLLEKGFATSLSSEADFQKTEEEALDLFQIRFFKALKEFRIFSKSKTELVVLRLTGGISGGDFSESKLDENKILVYPLQKVLRELAKDKKVKAILLEIDSPGGSAIHSEILYETILEVRKEKPVYGYFKDTAASGGYYIAMACETIFSSPLAIVGSIGAVMIRANLKKLYAKAKIQKESVAFYPHREIYSEYTPLTKASHALLEKETKRFETVFYSRVKAGRKFEGTELEESWGGGRIFLADKAKRLFDDFSSLPQAIDKIQEKLGAMRVETLLPEYNWRSSLPSFPGLSLPSGFAFSKVLFYSNVSAETIFSKRSKMVSENSSGAGFSKKMDWMFRLSHSFKNLYK